MQKLLFLLLLMLFSCAESAQSQTSLTINQVEEMLKTNTAIQLIDVRTPAEWTQTGVIKGALRINFNSSDFNTKIAQLDKNKPVIVYCAAGSRSPRAATAMRKMGFKTVFDYPGGMNDWLSKGRKTVQ